MSPATEVIQVESLASANPLESHFAEFSGQLQRVKATAETLIVLDESDARGMKLARETRLALKDIRCAIENKRKDLKDESLRRGQRIDHAARQMTALIEPLETRMLEQEQFALRAAAARKDALHRSRCSELQFFGVSNFILTGDLGGMSDQEYGQLLGQSKDAYEARLAREKKEREEAEAKARAEAEERERMRAENERLRAENQAREEAARVARAEAEEERKAAEAAMRAERERAAAEQDRREAEHQAALKQEREEREAAEAELRAKQAIDEAKRKAEAAAARKAAAAPDRAKLHMFADSLVRLPAPQMSTDEGRGLLEGILTNLETTALLIRKQADKL